ncbi:MAG: response regulator [Verrucomicrobia bacterium]|nr:response regulator [Verrucomicrobiota bacterium]
MTPPPNSSSSPRRSGFEADGSPPPNQFRVLIVDDQAANRRILSRLLNLTGYLTSEASDGQEALNHIASQAVDLVIMDVEMPNMDGLEATRQIRKLRDPRISSLPILAATGNPQNKIQQELLNSGANAFLTKPFDSQVLLKTLANLLSPSPDPSLVVKPPDKRNAKSTSVKNLP